MAFPKERCGPAAGMSQRASSPLSHGTVTWEELCPPGAPPPADQVLPCTVAQLAGGLCPSLLPRGGHCAPLLRGRSASQLRCVLPGSGASLCVCRVGLRRSGQWGTRVPAPERPLSLGRGRPVLGVDQGLAPWTHGVMPKRREAKVGKGQLVGD